MKIIFPSWNRTELLCRLKVERRNIWVFGIEEEDNTNPVVEVQV